MKKTNTPSVKRNILFSTAYQILLLIAPLITAPYVSRVLGADGIGIYSYTFSIQTYFALFAALGTVSYGTREIARNRDDEEKRSCLFFEIEALTIFTTFVCLVLWGIWVWISNEYQIYYIILTINLIAIMFDISWFYMGMERFEYIVQQNALFKVLGIVSIFFFVKDKQDITVYVLIMSLTVMLSNLSMWLYLPKFLRKIEIKNVCIWPHLKETLVYFIPTIASSIYTVLDKTLIGAITHDTSENGYYEQATKIINMAKSIAFVALNSVLEARMSYLFAEGKRDEMRERTKQSMNYIFFMGIAIVFGLIGVAPKFVPWFFGTGYDKVVILLQVLSPIVLIIGISNCLGSHYYNPVGLRALSAKFLIVGSVVNLVLNCVLIPHYESVGAAIASVFAELVITILYVTRCGGFIKMKELWLYSWRCLVAGAIMLWIIIVIGNSMSVSLVTIVTQVCTGATIYILLLLILKDDFVLGIIKEIRGKIKVQINGGITHD